MARVQRREDHRATLACSLIAHPARQERLHPLLQEVEHSGVEESDLLSDAGGVEREFGGGRRQRAARRTHEHRGLETFDVGRAVRQSAANRTGQDDLLQQVLAHQHQRTAGPP